GSDRLVELSAKVPGQADPIDGHVGHLPEPTLGDEAVVHGQLVGVLADEGRTHDGAVLLDGLRAVGRRAVAEEAQYQAVVRALEELSEQADELIVLLGGEVRPLRAERLPSHRPEIERVAYDLSDVLASVAFLGRSLQLRIVQHGRYGIEGLTDALLRLPGQRGRGAERDEESDDNCGARDGRSRSCAPASSSR